MCTNEIRKLHATHKPRWQRGRTTKGSRHFLPGGSDGQDDLDLGNDDMMTIYGLGATAAPRRTGRATTTGSGFRVAEDVETRATGTSAAAEVGWSGMLALQEAEGDAVQDREARRHGHDMLAELAGLQREMLADGIDPRRLQRLADMAKSVPQASDSRLRSVVGAVALRARIEMARWEMSGAGSRK